MYLESLEVVSRLPIPKVHGAVVGAGNQDTVGVDRLAIDDGVVSRQVLDELSLRQFPFFDVVRRGGGEHVQLQPYFVFMKILFSLSQTVYRLFLW